MQVVRFHPFIVSAHFILFKIAENWGPSQLPSGRRWGYALNAETETHAGSYSYPGQTNAHVGVSNELNMHVVELSKDPCRKYTG